MRREKREERTGKRETGREKWEERNGKRKTGRKIRKRELEKGNGNRETEIHRQIWRDTDKYRDTHTNAERHRQIQRDRDRYGERHIWRDTDSYVETQTDMEGQTYT